ncbi:hypothetical protein GF406_22605 [candidate division KSB1 bacterium]|nr:hypothetical protein [candidate division KSB1 bacterium]
MKKTFITILSIFYLISVVGFGTVYHYCTHHAESMDSPDESVRCCVHSATQSAECESAEIPAGQCYPGIMDSMLQDQVDEKTIQVNCCTIQHQYTQLDSSSFPLTVDFSQVVDRSGKELVHYPHYTPIPDGSVLTSRDPSTHINLPLLI